MLTSLTDTTRPAWLRRAGRLPWISLAVATVALLARGVAPAGSRFSFHAAEPDLVSALSCHLLHWSPTHLRWDVSTFFVLGCISETLHRGRYVMFLVTAAALVPPLACALSPQVTHYAGLSGLVIGQVALLLTAAARRSAPGPERTALWALLALLFVKQLYECSIGNTSLITMNYQSFATLPPAHLVSVLIGTLAAATNRIDARPPALAPLRWVR